jgi:GT2 family glycosyltransferase
VTYNRLEKLKNAIKYYESLTVVPKTIIVVNNNSTDGTKEYLEEWKNAKHTFETVIVNLEENLGGSAGFRIGMEKSMNIDYDYLIIGDDDAYPDSKMTSVFSDLISRNKYDVLCSKVIYNSGNIQLFHRRRVKKNTFTISELPVEESEYKHETFELDELSFVGVCINKKVIERVGLPSKDFFIQYDDTDYSIQIRKYYKIYCAPEAVMLHDIPEETYTTKIDWKYYYAIRNILLLYKRNFSFVYWKFLYWKIVLTLFRKKGIIKEIRRDAARDFKNENYGKNSKYLPGTVLKE